MDNTSDEDWDGVSLTLVAGLPVSFVHDLYTPRYIRRPVVEVKESTGVLPPMAEAGIESVDSFMMELSDSDGEEGRFGGGGPKMRKRGESFYLQGAASAIAASPPQRSAVSSFQTQTRERQVGDLFEYVIDQPVTVRRNQSALVPILLKPFAGRSVLLYQKQARAENPMRCVEFENTTGLTLEGGPVTVLDAGSYVGEAMLDTMKPTEKRLVGYAVELGVRVTDSIESHNQAVSRVIVRDGTLWTQYGFQQQTTYTFSSKADKEQTLYVDHPRPNREWELIEPATPHETTENFWRFKLALKPNATAAFRAVIRQPFSQSYALANANELQLAGWVSQKWLDAKTAKAIRATFALREELAKLEETIRQLDTERGKLHEEQKRIRENLTALGDRASEKELRERYIRSLGQQEDRLEQIDRERAAAVVASGATRQKLNEAIQGIAFEGTAGG